MGRWSSASRVSAPAATSIATTSSWRWSDLDTFWKEEFLKIAGKNQKYSSPKRFTYYKPEGTHTKCSDPATPGLYCTPAAYLYAGEVTINEPSLRKIHGEGDFGALIVLAHEWGHHIQNLLGRNVTTEDQTRFTIQDELARTASPASGRTTKMR